MGRNKKVILGQTKERLCEAGMECNYYRVCFDKYDNLTENCAINYCERCVGDDDLNPQRRSLMEEVQNILSNFKSYDDDGVNDKHCDLGTLDEIIKSLQNLWYNAHDSRAISNADKRCIEIAVRLLELLQQ